MNLNLTLLAMHLMPFEDTFAVAIVLGKFCL